MDHLDILWYFVPFVPLVVRGYLITRFNSIMADVLSEEVQIQDADANRSVIIGLVTLSFTGLLGLAVVDATLRKNLQLQVYFLLISFLCYMGALNLQGYKFHRWREQVSDAAREAGSLCLTLSVVTIIQVTYPNVFYSWGLTVLALGLWALNFIVKVKIDLTYLPYEQQAKQENTPQIEKHATKPPKDSDAPEVSLMADADSNPPISSTEIKNERRTGQS